MFEFFAPLFAQVPASSSGLLSLRGPLGDLPVIYQIGILMVASSILFALLYRVIMW